MMTEGKRRHRGAATFTAGGRQMKHIASSAIERRTRVLFVVSEFGDYLKTGGLGEVAADLSRAMRRHHSIRVLIPGYPEVLAGQKSIAVVGSLAACGGLPACDIGRITTRDGLVIYVLMCEPLFGRAGSPYTDNYGVDWPDNDIRFARLASAAADIALQTAHMDWCPDVVHVHDWQAALTPAYLAWRGSNMPTVLTIHNLAYQGLFDKSRLAALSIPDAAFRVDGAEFHGRISFLKAGIFYATHVNTVSPTYAHEITTPEYGCGLDGLLRARRDEGRLSGILNGIGPNWAAPEFVANDDAADDDYRTRKRRYAKEVRRSFGLTEESRPLFAIVSRLVHQKGVDIAIEASEAVVRNGGQLVTIGKGEEKLEGALASMAARHPDSIGVKIGFDESVARCMFAGSDFLLMPSRFEPCGLSQLYAQRCGSLPVARSCGGLADTIEDGKTGFLFRNPTVGDLLQAITRALEAFHSPTRIDKMRRAAMARNFGWKNSAERYSSVLKSVLAT